LSEPSPVTHGVIDAIGARRIVAVLRSASADDALEVAEVLLASGITALELTFTIPDAAAAIRELGRRHGDTAVIGAGSVTRPGQAAEAASAGARFLVSPGFDPGLFDEMRATGCAVLPGVLTPSEVMAAHAAGADALKIFPAATVGPGYLTALRGPFPNVRLMPTGGVSAATVGDWFDAGAWAVGAGGWLAPPRVGEHGRAEIEERAAALLRALG
jgi:2-dehydro-3-deoxyphosphogluconate aldolase/(4S)-4-hydroxy-2-oxoglutarate aldolase